MTSATEIDQANVAARGVLLVALSAVLWSTVGVFAKGASADNWAVLFIRGFFTSALLVLYLRATAGIRLADYVRLGRDGWAAAIVGGIASICFITAFKLTSIANVAILFATSPFLAALFAWIALKEAPSRLTMLAAGVTLIGVAVMFAGSLGTVHLAGDLLACVMVALMSVLIVMYRAFATRTMMRANVVSIWLTMIVAGLIGTPLTTGATDVVIIAALGLVFAAAMMLMTEGAKHIPVSRTALIGTIETPLAPVWAWAVLSELPPATTWIGGAIVMAAVVWHVWAER